MRTVALIVFLAFIALANASLSESNIFRGSRPIIKFCDSHCNEACGRLQVQSDFKMRCENACRWSCDHKRNAHLQPAVMSDAKFFKKAFKKIKGVVKKVTSVVKKVVSAPTALLTKVVAKLPLPSGLKKVLSVVAPIALGFVTGGAGALSGLKSIGFVSKAINAVKATKVFQVGMKVVNTVKKVKDVVDKVKGVVNTVKGIAKGDFSAIGGLAGQIGGIGSSVGGKFGQFTQNIGNKINSIGGKVVSTIKNSAPYKAFQNIKGKVMDIKNKITGKINGIVGKVVDFKNNALGKLDKFGVIGGFIKDKINDKINSVVDGVKGKIQDKIQSVKDKILQKTGLGKFVNGGAQEEGPAPEGPAEAAPQEAAPVDAAPQQFQESANPGEDPAPVAAAPQFQEAANPGEEVSSDVETFKRKRGGRKQKKVQPVAEEAQE